MRVRLGRDGSTAVEFAIVSAVFLPLCLVILQLGVIMWAQGTMQSTASQLARCAAISSPSCPSSGYTTFAQTTWEQWIFSAIATDTGNVVTVTPGICNSPVKVTEAQITCTYWSWLINPFIKTGTSHSFATLQATAYFPSGTC